VVLGGRRITKKKEAEQGTPHGLLDAFKRLFKLKD